MTCLNNLRQWGVALNAYHNDYGAFPVGNVEPPDYYGGNWNGGWWAFKAKLLPCMEANNVCKLCNFTYSSLEPFMGACWFWMELQPPGSNPAVMILSQDKCPDDPRAGANYNDPQGGTWACGNYLGVDGSQPWVRPASGMPMPPSQPTDGILVHSKLNLPIRLSQVTDGASHTLIMGERGISDELFGWPYCGSGDNSGSGDGDNLMSTQQGLSPGLPDGSADYRFWSYHPNLCQFICADGSGHVLSYDIDLPTYPGTFDSRGGEIVQMPPGW